MTDLTTILQGHLLTVATPDAPAESHFEPAEHDTPGLGMDDSTMDGPQDRFEAACEEFESLGEVETSLEGLLNQIQGYAEEGLNAQGMLFATNHYNQIASACGLRTASLEDATTASLESNVKSLIANVVAVLKKLWAKAVELYRAVIKHFLSVYSQLGSKAKRLGAEAKALSNKWLRGEKVQMAGKWHYLSIDGDAVKNLEPMNKFMLTADSYLVESWKWVHAVRGVNNATRGFFDGSLSTIPPLSNLAFSSPAGFVHTNSQHATGLMDIYETKPSFGGRQYTLCLLKHDAKERPTHIGAVNLTAENFHGEPAGEGFEMPLADPEYFGVIERAIGNIKTHVGYSTTWAEEAEEMFDRASSAMATHRMKSATEGKEDPTMKACADVMMLSGATAMGILRGVRTMTNDAYLILKAHLDWAELSLNHVKNQAQPKASP